MRCKECNIDVSENVTRCPLCGSPVSDEPAVLEGLCDIPYPQSVMPAPKDKNKITAFTVAKHFTRVSVAAATVMNVAGRVTDNPSLVSCASALGTSAASVSLAACLAEKGELLKGATPLLISTLSVAACALPAGRKKKTACGTVLRLGSCLLMNCAAYLSAPEKMKEQYKAVFRITGEQK